MINDISEKQYQELLDISRRDLRSCETLHKSGDFANSVYLLQQSIEKSAKALVVFVENRPFTDDEFRDIGHKAITIYENLAKTKRAQFVQAENFYGEHQAFKVEFSRMKIFKENDLEKILNQSIESLDKFIEDIKVIKQEQKKRIQWKIDTNILESFNRDSIDYDDIMEKIPESLQNIPEKDLNELKIDFFRQFLLTEYYDIKTGTLRNIPEKDWKDIEELYLKINLQDFIKLSEIDIKYRITEYFINRNLPNLLVITLPHWLITRYPEADLSLTPKIYDKSLPIVEKLPELIKMQDKILDLLNELKKLKNEYIVELTNYINKLNEIQICTNCALID